MRSLSPLGVLSLALSVVLLASSARPAGADLVPGSFAVDTGDDAAAWTALASPSATARIDEVGGAVGLAFDLGRGRGHAIARRPVSIDLPEDWMLVFVVHGEGEPNTIEIKLVSGENVWWKRLADFRIPHDATELRVAKPRLAFAWGPAGGGMPSHVDAIEIAVVAGSGGRGKLWLDEIRLEPRDAKAASVPPAVAVSSSASDAPGLSDGSKETVWKSAPDDPAPTVTLDFHQSVEQGGLVVDFAAAGGAPRAYVVEASRDGRLWQEQRRFARAAGPRDRIFLPDLFTRYLRLRFDAGAPVAIAELRPQPYDFSSSPNAFFTAIARDEPRGLYPRYFQGEQSYWAVTGTPGGTQEALVNEEGAVEVDAGAFTLEPFVVADGKLRSWSDDPARVRLRHGDLPIPTVERHGLEIAAFAGGDADDGTLYVRYRVRSHVGTDDCPPGAAECPESRAEPAAGDERGAPDAKRRVRLVVAIRPFQVLPPWQALNRTGGVAPVRRIEREGRTVRVDDRRVVLLREPDAFGAAAFEQGDPVVALARGERVPASDRVDDPFGHASALMAWDLEIDGYADVWVAVPWTPRSPVAATAAGAEAALRDAEQLWSRQIDRVPLRLPDPQADLLRAMRANLAWILVNRDGPAFHPGSRTYERSWIRDGAMTSGALLELGFDDEVKDFLRWYAGYVGGDGFAPCCIDARGADPVPENDSYGEFLWAVAETWRFTRDDGFVRELWPVANKVADCMRRLRATRRTAEYEAGERRAMRGLLPESISHEGYSARPVHSYWDQTFALRGFADASLLARIAGDTAAADRFEAERAAMDADLRASIREVMQRHALEVVPASVELADFDPTSTANAFLLGLEDLYPRKALELSFEKYVADFRARRGLRTRGVGYTAYELRSATALMLLGRGADAHELLSTMVADQRPPAWRQWPEISWLDAREPSFLGDLPHTWIGSTYVHAVRSLLAVEREHRTTSTGPGVVQSLLVGAGVPADWLRRGEVASDRLPTWFGPVSLSMRGESRSGVFSAIVDLDEAKSDRAGERRWLWPDGGIVVAAPFGAEVDAVTVDGNAARLEEEGVRVHRLPASVVFQYKP